MQWKQLIWIPLIASLAACNSNDNDAADRKNEKLPASLVNNPYSANGTDTAMANGLSELSLVDTIHNFGALHEGEVANYEFAFTNTGKSPLLITGAQGSCGCTVAQWPHDPIAPGKGGVMKVQFNTADKYGHQEKSVSVTTNARRGNYMLYITADIEKSKDAPAQ